MFPGAALGRNRTDEIICEGMERDMDGYNDAGRDVYSSLRSWNYNTVSRVLLPLLHG